MLISFNQGFWLSLEVLRLVGDNISQALDHGNVGDADTLVLKSIENEIIGMNLFLCLARGWIKRTDASPENLPSVLDILD